MKPKAVKYHNFTSQDELFLDTNIWLDVFGLQKLGNNRVTIYSAAFHRILNANSKVYIDILVVSEFINVCVKQKWKLVRRSAGDFKKFRKSRHFKPTAQGIVADVKRILKHSLTIESSFPTLPIADLLDEYANGHYDFNDQVITELCRNNGLTLITHDGDFRSQEIPVLTANKSLLR